MFVRTVQKKRKEHLHCISILLKRAQIIENHTGELLQPGEFLRQTQVAFGREQPLNQGGG